MRDPLQSHALKNAEALPKSHHNLLPYAQEYKDSGMSIRFLHSVHLVLIVMHITQLGMLWHIKFV